MSTIQLHGKSFEIFLPEALLQEKIAELAAQINADYAGKKPLFIAVLNGSFMFAADLFKSVTIEAEICFIKLASYKGTTSTGQVITAIGLDMDLTNRHVIVLEDIIDTGKTLHTFLPFLYTSIFFVLFVECFISTPIFFALSYVYFVILYGIYNIKIL